MKKKQYKLGLEAREDIKAVATQVRDIIGSTLGPAGRNYFLPVGITNDGVTIMEHIRFEDECQDQISLAFHEIARQQDKDGGDNTSTAMFLGANIILDNIDKVMDINIPSNISVMSLLSELEVEKDKVVGLLKDKVVEVKSVEDLYKVALTASERDDVAKIVSEAVFKTGKDAFPRIDYGFNGKIETAVIEGIEMPLKLENIDVFNSVDKAEYNNAFVVVANHCFEKYLEIAPFLKSMLDTAMQTKNKNPLVIVGKQFSIPFVQSVSGVVRATGLPIILLSANFHNDTFEDIASFVDANLIDTHPKRGNKITDLRITDAGFVKTIISRDSQTQFIGGRGTELMDIKGSEAITRVSKRVGEIKEKQLTEKDAKEREQMDRRIGALLGGIITIYIDAKTTTERFYLKKKVEDAINSCVGALNDGMVKGGGLSFKEIAEELGDSMLSNALKSSYDRIIQNNGGNELVLDEVFDSFRGMKSAIENAISTTKIVLTLEGVIADIETSPTDLLVEKINK